MLTNAHRQTFEQALKDSLPESDRMDVLSGYFYFSGFALLAKELADKRIRILVGMTVDPDVVERLSADTAGGENPALEEYDPQRYSRLTRTGKKDTYIKSFQQIVRNHPLHDSTEEQAAFHVFERKLRDGSLEIKLCSQPHHGKAYILKRPEEQTVLGAEPGVVFMGSANFTYNGLRGQNELVEELKRGSDFEKYTAEFASWWEDAIDICVEDDSDDFLEAIEKTWLGSKKPPLPYEVYIRILSELYAAQEAQEAATPSEITGAKFRNLMYQLDAIRQGLDIIHKNHGVIVADVVGLGKSIIASSLAYNLDMPQCVIIAPPHLVPQWKDYAQHFSLRGVLVCSGGKMEATHEKYALDDTPTLYIIDEAHRYRNESTDDYQWLHQLTRSHAENNVILLTATPYNNRPQDLFALVKLFQTPSRSTIQSVDNLGLRFHQLIADYKRAAGQAKKNRGHDELPPAQKAELERIGRELRLLIEPVVIRRSRIDLKNITAYAEDIAAQGISFPEVIGPELVRYELGDIRTLYLETLQSITSDDGFIGARYKATDYLKNAKVFFEKYGHLYDEHEFLLAQRNLAQMMKRLLVQRFESSKFAFKSTLDKMIASHEHIVKFWDRGYVPLKRGDLPDPDDVEIDDLMEHIEQGEEINTKHAVPVPCALFNEDFLDEVRHDLTLLLDLRMRWFPDDAIGDDPKLDCVAEKIRFLLAEHSRRKIVVFSSYADTAGWVARSLQAQGLERTLLYTGSTQNLRDTVSANFDASLPKAKQKNDYDIIVATDALSEGFNLHRAGVIINYDIPYNPTRVVQRIGRINRINKKVFDAIYIYNLFPTEIGENVTNTKGVSTLKMLLINAVVGSDTRTLTPDETLESYFKRQVTEADEENETPSWDNQYRNDWNAVKHNTQLLSRAGQIPTRSRLVRTERECAAAVSFARRGNNALFAIAREDGAAAIAPPEEVLPLFKAALDEKAQTGDAELDALFALLRDKVTAPPPVPPVEGNRKNALAVIKAMISMKAPHRDFLIDLRDSIKDYDDLSDGELKFIARFDGKLGDLKAVVSELETKFSANYLTVIKQRAEAAADSGVLIQFTEELRK